MEWFDKILFWHWWILAGALLILELTSPVFFFLWLGFSAAAVGFLLYWPGAGFAKFIRLNPTSSDGTDFVMESAESF